jgi:ABC-2 type transport system ATP-binding protein
VSGSEGLQAGDAVVAVDGLRKSYGDVEAVRGISFEVARGEIFGFLGPNGAGKSTTIEILEGYRERSGGDARVLGADPGRPTRAWRDRIGLVLQESELEPALTVRETVAMFAGFYSKPRAVDEVIELVGLGEKRDARVGSLSGGQRRRADVAVAIVGDPELLFLDEPTTGFDPSARREAWSMIEGLRALGTTIMLTTHYMDEAQHLSDRVAIIAQGQIVAEGRPDELGGSRRTATIRFELPDGVDPAVVEAELGAPLERAGALLSLATERPQQALYRLTGWAERSGVELEGLAVERPTLEDVFLALTGAGAEQAAAPVAEVAAP